MFPPHTEWTDYCMEGGLDRETPPLTPPPASSPRLHLSLCHAGPQGPQGALGQRKEARRECAGCL